MPPADPRLRYSLSRTTTSPDLPSTKHRLRPVPRQPQHHSAIPRSQTRHSTRSPASRSLTAPIPSHGQAITPPTHTCLFNTLAAPPPHLHPFHPIDPIAPGLRASSSPPQTCSDPGQSSTSGELFRRKSTGQERGQTNPLHPGEHSAHTGKTRRPISHWRHGQADKWLCPRRDHSPPEPGRKPRGHTGRSERRWTNSYPLGRTINPVPGRAWRRRQQRHRRSMRRRDDYTESYRMPLDHHTQATAGQPVTKHGLHNPHPSNPHLHHRHDRPPHRNTQREEGTKGTTAAPAREPRPPSSSRSHQRPILRSQKSPLPSCGAEPGTQPDLPHGQQSTTPGQSLGPAQPSPSHCRLVNCASSSAQRSPRP